MKVLLLSAYAAYSHVQWQNALQAMLRGWQWRVLTLPPRHFSWRVRGNALYWSQVEREALEADYDLLLATSMTDLATLRGLVPALATLPTVLYFHENQFAYPQAPGQHNLVEAQVTSIYSALAADRIVFNSRYNHDSFMQGCEALLRKLPDFVPPGIGPMLRERASVLAVPFDGGGPEAVVPRWPSAQRGPSGRPLRLLWVGRFEHDKGGDGLLRVLEQLELRGLDYEVAVTGQQFRQSPAVFEQIRTRFDHRLVHFGFVDNPLDYRALLHAADIVLSTAQHEFQGLAVMEAVARGCHPVVPRRLVYPEIYPAACCYESRPDDPLREASSAAVLIAGVVGNPAAGEAARAAVAEYGCDALAPRYQQLFYSTAASA
ncbi:MAG: DUF3524 domain-containing protein [Halioglobus sp.]|nr:DUF3524 domain-containing protein [Halioglobus sp.]